MAGTIFDLLPLIGGWKYDPVQYKLQELPGNEEQNLYFQRGEIGWILGVGATIDR